MSRDAGGKTIDARELPRGAGPPYRGETLWRGREGGWCLEAVRIQGDPVPHCVAHHSVTGIAHAERIEHASPAKLREWARGLPERLP